MQGDNMADTFKREHRQLKAAATHLIQKIKLIAEKLEDELIVIKSLEMSLAITNLEQCIMWETKAIAIDNEK